MVEHWCGERLRGQPTSASGRGPPPAPARRRRAEPYSSGTSDKRPGSRVAVDLAAIAQRTDFDLKRHAEASGGEKLAYFDHASASVVPTGQAGGWRTLSMMDFLLSSYYEDEFNGEPRTVPSLHHRCAYQVAVLPSRRRPLPGLPGGPHSLQALRHVRLRRTRHRRLPAPDEIVTRLRQPSLRQRRLRAVTIR